MARVRVAFLKLSDVDTFAIERKDFINDTGNTNPVPLRQSLRLHEPSKISDDDIIVEGSISNQPFSHGISESTNFARPPLAPGSRKGAEVDDHISMTMQSSGAIAHGPKGRYQCSNCRATHISVPMRVI